MNLPESIADAIMIKMVAKGSLSRADIIEAIEMAMERERQPVAIEDAPMFWPRPWQRANELIGVQGQHQLSFGGPAQQGNTEA